jgi:hypothetical protein
VAPVYYTSNIYYGRQLLAPQICPRSTIVKVSFIAHESLRAPGRREVEKVVALC